jgi:hypothetical protein
MPVEMLGEAWKLGWTCTAHCYWLGPNKDGTRQHPWCDTRYSIDMLTLVLTRGERFPLARLPEVLKCPKCGFRKVRVFFQLPNNSNKKAAVNE